MSPTQKRGLRAAYVRLIRTADPDCRRPQSQLRGDKAWNSTARSAQTASYKWQAFDSYGGWVQLLLARPIGIDALRAIKLHLPAIIGYCVNIFSNNRKQTGAKAKAETEKVKVKLRQIILKEIYLIAFQAKV